MPQDRDITKLHPRLQEVAKKVKAKFPNILIYECLRSVEYQDELYAKGRTKPGVKVTNSKGKDYGSQHQWGIAFDFGSNQKGNLYPPAFMKEVGAYVKSLGCGWGGDWKNPVDQPHVYLSDWGKTTAELKKKYGNPDKFKATWKPVSTTFYNGLDYAPVFNADFYLKYHADVARDSYFGSRPFEHFTKHGMREGRQAIDSFNVKAYRQKYEDLRKEFGDDLPKYYEHYIRFGIKEKRTSS